MGQKDKQIRHMTIAILSEKYIKQVQQEIVRLKDPKLIEVFQDRFGKVVRTRVNRALDHIGKKQITPEEEEILEIAYKFINEAFQKDLEYKKRRYEEKEQERLEMIGDPLRH